MKNKLGASGMTAETSNTHSVSIVICSKNRRNSMLATLRSLERYSLDIRLLEVIIVEETDDPQPPPGAKVKYFHIPERGLGLAFARNLGLQKARGSLVVFIDDDIVPASQWLDALTKPFDDPNVQATAGAILPDLSEINTVGRCISFLGFPAGGLKRYLEAEGKNEVTAHISGGNCAVRAHTAIELGGFDEFMRGVEDTDFFSRMAEHKKKMLFIPTALAFHKQRNSLKETFDWFIRRGIGDFYLKCKQGGPVRALILPLRMNFTLKLLSLLLFLWTLFSLFHPGIYVALILAPFLWNQLLWHRIHRTLWKRPLSDETDGSVASIRYEVSRPEVKRILFLVKFLMDLGDEVGTFIAFFRFVRNRIFSKPFVLTFHYLDDKSPVQTFSFKKYFYSATAFEQLLRDFETGGYIIVSLSSMIKRLREKSNVLFLDRILAVTFDDAHEGTHTHLASLGETGRYPIMIFVPTQNTGKMIQWDPEMHSSAGKVMDWDQIKALKDLGLEIGSHTRSHPRLTHLAQSLVTEEIRGSMSDLESRFPGCDPKQMVFSYPYGAYSNEIKNAVKDAGYIGAVANFPGNIRPCTDPFEIPRFAVSSGSDWKDVINQSRSMWIKDLLKDFRDWAFR